MYIKNCKKKLKKNIEEIYDMEIVNMIAIDLTNQLPPLTYFWLSCDDGGGDASLWWLPLLMLLAYWVSGTRMGECIGHRVREQSRYCTCNNRTARTRRSTAVNLPVLSISDRRPGTTICTPSSSRSVVLNERNRAVSLSLIFYLLTGRLDYLL